MIERHSAMGVDWSVVRLGGVRHVYVTALPRAGTDVADQTHDAMSAIRAAMEQLDMHEAVVEQTVFVSHMRHIETCRRVVEAFCGHQMPAATYVPQAVCQDRLVAIEAHGIGRDGGQVRIERPSKQLVIARLDGLAWCYCGDIVNPAQNGSLYCGTVDALARMARLLQDAGFDFSQVVRTWLYLGDIAGPETSGPRYQELNRARADFYAGVRFHGSRAGTTAANGFYPASTGIGAQGSDVAMSCTALVSRRDDLVVVPLENPNQTSACEYDARHRGRNPRFSRAVAVVADGAATVFISGTASITGAESRHPDDVERQTHQTLDNIETLIGPENLRLNGIGNLGATLRDLAYIRVYLKRPGDYEKAREICRQRVGQLPVIYAVADICRSELLVEIEGVAFSAP